MASPCNSLNVQTIKISSLSGISGRATTLIQPEDILFLIQSGSTAHPTSLFSRKVTFSDLTDYISNTDDGQYSGSFTGSFEGLLTGGVEGYMSASAEFDGLPAFYGTASWAVSSSRAVSAAEVDNGALTSGGNTIGNFGVWTGTDTIDSTSYLGTLSIANYNFSSGRIYARRPIQWSNTVGEDIIFYSGSHQSVYGMGTQTNTAFTRTNLNYAIYYSGSYSSTAFDAGTDGWGVLETSGRKLGIGDFGDASYIDAQCHIHLSDPTGWSTGYDENANVLLITSGSSFTSLLRVGGDGQLDVGGDIVSFSTFASSDERLKTNIQPISDAYNKISLLNPVSFNWNIPSSAVFPNGETYSDFGLIAQEVEQLYPNLVKDDIRGYKSIKYTSFIAVLIKVVQDQQKQIEDLTTRIEALETP